jgi:FKBP-type peptidyl-prolyl cis-trans isomerase
MTVPGFSMTSLIRFLGLLALLFSPLALHAQREKLPPEDLAIVVQRWPEAKRTSTGLRSQLLKPGTGERPKPGQLVTVNYKGSLLDGTVFEENLDPAKAFTFRLGRNVVIDGWEEGIQLMQVGETRIFIIPFELGYGTRGQPPKIPRRATLIFEVTLVAMPPDPVPGAK